MIEWFPNKVGSVCEPLYSLAAKAEVESEKAII